MDINSLRNLRLEGELSDCLWLHFDVTEDIQLRCEQALHPHQLDWSNPYGDGHIAVPYESGEFTSDESPIIGGLMDLPDFTEEFQDFLTDLSELAHRAMDSQDLQLEWMLGVPKAALTHYHLKLTTSYYGNRSLCLAINNKTGEAFFYFEDHSYNCPYYTGNYKAFESLKAALEHFNAIYRQVEWDDFSVVSRFFDDIEATHDI